MTLHVPLHAPKETNKIASLSSAALRDMLAALQRDRKGIPRFADGDRAFFLCHEQTWSHFVNFEAVDFCTFEKKTAWFCWRSGPEGQAPMEHHAMIALHHEDINPPQHQHLADYPSNSAVTAWQPGNVGKVGLPQRRPGVSAEGACVGKTARIFGVRVRRGLPGHQLAHRAESRCSSPGSSFHARTLLPAHQDSTVDLPSHRELP